MQMTGTTHRLDSGRRSLLPALGLLLGLVLALVTAPLPWEAVALGLGFVLAALVGLAQTCTA